MSFNHVPAGKDLPQDFNVIIEIPAQSDPVKYEADKDLGLLVVDRFISTGMRYPANYGFIPQTLSGDGDPVDVLVITPFPLLAGSVVRARALGMLQGRRETAAHHVAEEIEQHVVETPVMEAELFQKLDGVGMRERVSQVGGQVKLGPQSLLPTPARTIPRMPCPVRASRLAANHAPVSFQRQPVIAKPTRIYSR